MPLISRDAASNTLTIAHVPPCVCQQEELSSFTERCKAAERLLQEQLQSKERELDHVHCQLATLSLRAEEATAHLELTVRRWEEERGRWQRELADTIAVADLKVLAASCQSAVFQEAFDEERKRLECEVAAAAELADEGIDALISVLELAVRRWEERRSGEEKLEDALKDNVTRLQHSLELSEDARRNLLSELEAQRERQRLTESVRAAESEREKERERACEKASHEVQAQLISMDVVCMRADDAVAQLHVALQAMRSRAVERERILEEEKEREMLAKRQSEAEWEAILEEKDRGMQTARLSECLSEEARILAQRQLDGVSERAESAIKRLECAVFERETAGAVQQHRVLAAEAAVRGVLGDMQLCGDPVYWSYLDMYIQSYSPQIHRES